MKSNLVFGKAIEKTKAACHKFAEAFLAFPASARVAVLLALAVGFGSHFVWSYLSSWHRPIAEVATLPSDVAPVAVTGVLVRDIENSFSGHAILQPWKEVTLHPDQQVTIREVSAHVGTQVQKGQPLAQVESEVQGLKKELDQISMKLRESDYKVTLALARRDFISANERKQKILEHRAEQLRAKISELESNGRLIAPISGVVSEIQLKSGDYVDNSANYFIKIVDPTMLKVLLYLPHTAAQKLKAGSPVEFRRTEPGDDGVDHVVTSTGKIDAIAPVVDSKTGSVLVEVVLNSFPSSWRPGLSVEAMLSLDRALQAVVVPTNAVVYQKDQPYVYRVKAPEIREPASAQPTLVERVPVKLGIRDSTHVQVTLGLANNDMVVVEGQGALTDGAKVEIVH